MNLELLRDARDEAARGLRELLAEIEALRRKEQHLTAAIDSLELAIGDDQDSGPTLATRHSVIEMQQLSAEPLSEGRPYWEIAKELLEEKNEPMSVPQMSAILNSRGYKVPGDSLRVAMIRRQDVFAKAGYGQYRLASWPTGTTESDSEEGAAPPTPEESFGNCVHNTPYMSHMMVFEGKHA